MLVPVRGVHPDGLPWFTAMLAKEDLLELIEHANNGDSQAQKRLLEDLYESVHKHLNFTLYRDPLTEEAVQESMLEIYKSLPRFRDKISVRAWALRIATRTGRRYLQREKRHRDRLTEDGSVPTESQQQDPVAQDDLRRLHSYIGTLTRKKREAFVLMEILEMSAKEAADIIGTFANTAASRHRHAKAEICAMFVAEQPSATTPRKTAEVSP